MNKKRFFILSVGILIALCICSFVFSRLFSAAYWEFSHAGGGFLVATWQAFEIKYALIPNKRGMVNSVKKMYHQFGKQKLYRIQCWVIFSIFLFIGIVKFISALCIIL